MKKSVFVMLVLLAICLCRPMRTGAESRAAAAVSGLQEAAEATAGSEFPEPETLREVLEALSDFPDASAGSSLRLASLLGALADLVGEAPEWAAWEAPRPFVRSLAPAERAELAGRLAVLRSWAEETPETLLNGLLEDAGAAPLNAGQRRAVCRLLAALEALLREEYAFFPSDSEYFSLVAVAGQGKVCYDDL